MRITNIIDEEGRFCGFYADDSFGEQRDTHTISYHYARENYYKYGNEAIGLEVEGLQKELLYSRIEEILIKLMEERNGFNNQF